MHPVDGRPLPKLDEQHQKAVTRWSQRIKGRTGLHPWWNERTGAVHFCKDAHDPGVSPTAPTVRNRDGIVRFPDEDWVCRSIYRARMPKALKDRAHRSAELAGQHARTEGIEKAIADSRPDQLDRARSQLRNRVSVTI